MGAFVCDETPPITIPEFGGKNTPEGKYKNV